MNMLLDIMAYMIVVLAIYATAHKFIMFILNFKKEQKQSPCGGCKKFHSCK